MHYKKVTAFFKLFQSEVIYVTDLSNIYESARHFSNFHSYVEQVDSCETKPCERLLTKEACTCLKCKRATYMSKHETFLMCKWWRKIWKKILRNKPLGKVKWVPSYFVVIIVWDAQMIGGVASSCAREKKGLKRTMHQQQMLIFMTGLLWNLKRPKI